MKTRRHRRRTINRRQGFQALELLFAVTAMVAILATVLQWGKTLMIRSGVVQAATVAAREAAKGAGIAEVARAVNGVLAVHGVAVTDQPGSGTKVAVQNGRGKIEQYGDPTIPVHPALIGSDETLATVWIEFDAKRIDGRGILSASSRVLGRALGETGLGASSLAKRELAESTTARSRNMQDNQRGVPKAN